MPVLTRSSENPILAPVKEHPWESVAVMNASVVAEGNTTHMLYRALGDDVKELPIGTKYNYSYIGYAKSRDGINFERNSTPFISPDTDFDRLGCEDPRVTKIDNYYYIFYTAVSENLKGLKIQIAGARTKDFKTCEKLGIVSLQGNCKAAALFPEKINGKYAFLYTQDADSPRSTIYYALIDSVDVLFDKNKWEKVGKVPLVYSPANVFRGPELGAVPVKTEKGWLLIYCPEASKPEWQISALLLDLKDPTKVIGKAKKPILKPEEPYELFGYVDNVVFPSGAVDREDELFVYYGAADSSVCLASCKLDKLLASLV